MLKDVRIYRSERVKLSDSSQKVTLTDRDLSQASCQICITALIVKRRFNLTNFSTEYRQDKGLERVFLIPQ